MRHITMLCLLFAAFATSGCATMSSAPGTYSVSGVTTSPIEATAVAGEVYRRQYDSETYRRAVESGRAYPYAGGMGGDYWYHYRGVRPATPLPVAPPASTTTVVPPASTSSVAPPVEGDALAEAREARRRADAAAVILERLRAHMMAEEADAGTPAVE